MTHATTPVAAAVHALLSASGSKKWIACPPSARLEATFSDERSGFAAEGSFAHGVFQHLIEAYLGLHIADLRPFKDSPYWSADLLDHVTAAVEVAKQLIEEIRATCPDAQVLVEQRLDYSDWVPEGFGTGDLVIVADGTLIIIDYKHGKGVSVEAQGNSQMRLYGLGAVAAYAHLYDIRKVRTQILQPRLNNYSSEEISIEELMSWADTVVKPAAALAFEGKGTFTAGDHCSSGFCKARFNCRARAEANLNLARAEFALTPPELLTIEEVSQVLTVADQLQKWAADVVFWALKEAEAGRTVEGWKLVAGRSTRKLTDQDEAAARLVAGGLSEDQIFTRDLLGITALEKLLGKARFNELLDGLITMSAAKPVLVPLSDKRPALSSASSAVEDFGAA